MKNTRGLVPVGTISLTDDGPEWEQVTPGEEIVAAMQADYDRSPELQAVFTNLILSGERLVKDGKGRSSPATDPSTD